jgi:hemerythrin-like domain-containing protein
MKTDERHVALLTLVAEHEACRQFLEDTTAALSLAASGRKRTAKSALGQAWSLLQFLEGELETHIAKEEGPLFPRLRAALPADDRLVDEMVAEHDLIPIKRGDVRFVLTDLLEAHDDLRLDREALRTSLTTMAPSQASLVATQRAMNIVAAKLHVHFEKEEGLVFPLATELLSRDELGQIAVEMDAIGGGALVT